ncbi:ThuA domain-containing protein [Stieleria varia]|uniref:Trehalose utilization n=1 Tax=Stieleria varia TaxID=2528005 RepID=A0A5C6A3B0_9BACT|nr:ThuA domain-containing protein [Stieleria varia]TWT94394.1 Trehalose utilization [Stieleria varia]
MLRVFAPMLLIAWISSSVLSAAQPDRLVFAVDDANAKRVVLVSGDEEYRTEETMPMLAKLLSKKHGFHCTVLFSLSADGSYIDPNNSQGVRGWDSLADADLMIIGTRFRTPSEEDAKYITDFLNAGKPVIGIRTSTHAFNGRGSFGDSISYGKFGLLVLGEQWVNHHGQHKREGARSVVVAENEKHPILNSVGEIFALSDVYGVTHLTDADSILLRAAVTQTLDPESPNVDGPKNDPMQPLAWLHPYVSDSGKKGNSFCTTAGASVDFLDADLRRLIVNAAFHLTGRDVPAKADVEFVDPFHPSFYGFIKEKSYFADRNMQPSDFDLGKPTEYPDPPGSPQWNAEAAKMQ